MTFADSIGKTRKDIEKAIGGKSPLLALAGVSDLAAEGIRAARAEITARASQIDAKALREQAQSRLAALPGLAQEFPTKAQSAAEDAVTTAFSGALTAYGDLSDRGRALVGRVRRQQSTVQLKQQASDTVAKAKAARTTAEKSAARTKTSAKAATTSAKKTAKAAKKAADDTASKLGD
jgi:hypothetical protein